MKNLKFLFVFAVLMHFSFSAFSQSHKPINVKLESLAQDLDFDKINLLTRVKNHGNANFGFVIYYKNSKVTSVIECKDEQFSKAIHAQRASELIIIKLKSNQPTVLQGADLEYIFSN